jgi:hypothetical protein
MSWACGKQQELSVTNIQHQTTQQYTARHKRVFLFWCLTIQADGSQG